MNCRPIRKSPLSENLRQRHIGEFPPALVTGKDQGAAVVDAARPLQDGHRLRRKGNPMGRSRLRPITGDALLAGLSIYLAPSRSASLPGSRRRQDQEPEAKFGHLARLRPNHGFKRRRYYLVRQRPEVSLDGWHGRQRAVYPFPGHILIDVAMRPTPLQHRALSLLEAVSGRTIRDCERVRHPRRRSAASSALVSRSRAMPTGGLLRVNQDETRATIKVRLGDRDGGMVLGEE